MTLALTFSGRAQICHSQLRVSHGTNAEADTLISKIKRSRASHFDIKVSASASVEAVQYDVSDPLLTQAFLMTPNDFAGTCRGRRTVPVNELSADPDRRDAT